VNANVSTVLHHGSDHLLGSTRPVIRFSVKWHADVSANESRQVRDHLLGDSARVAAHARRIELHGAVEPSPTGSGRLYPLLTIGAGAAIAANATGADRRTRRQWHLGLELTARKTSC